MALVSKSWLVEESFEVLAQVRRSVDRSRATVERTAARMHESRRALEKADAILRQTRVLLHVERHR